MSSIRKSHRVTRVEALCILRRTDPKNSSVYWEETNKEVMVAVVIEGHTLAVLTPARGTYQILHASVLRGATQKDGWNYLLSKKYRFASRRDFDEFGVDYHPDYIVEK